MINTAPIDTEKSNFNYKIGGLNDNFRGVLVSDRSSIVILPGDSLELRRIREDAERSREADKLARRTVSRQSTSSRYAGAVEVIAVDYTNNCVAWSKKQTGINRPLGPGARNAIQGTEPRVGAIGSTKGTAHAVVVVAISGNMITFNESNYRRNVITRRTLSIDQFIGFVYG